MDGAISSRDKNDIFWLKKRRYLVSADLKSQTMGGHFNPDMAAEIKSEYSRYDRAVAIHDLTGDEFMDHPPTASGQIAFAKSIAMMMHTLDMLEDPESDAADFSAAFFMDIIDEAKVLIREIIDAFILACGVDSEGNEYRDIKKKKAAREAFFEKRKEYQLLIKTERRIAGWEMIDIIREANGIDDLMETDATGEDPNLIKLIEENREAASEYREEVESLCRVSRNALIEMASLMAGRRALYEPVKRRLDDESQNEGTRRLLKGAYDSYLFDSDMRLRALLFKSQAVYYMVRWLLLKEPVDEIIAERIAMISKERPDVLEGYVKISNIPGYANPKGDVNLKLPECDDVDTIFEMGEKVQQYLYDHPHQFEAQCLLAIVRDLDELSEILPVSRALVQTIDMLTMSEKYAAFPEDVRQRIFDIWVISGMVCRIGCSIMETIVEDPEKTVKDATDILRSMVRMLSFSREEKKVRNTLAKVVMERSGVRVY